MASMDPSEDLQHDLASNCGRHSNRFMENVYWILKNLSFMHTKHNLDARTRLLLLSSRKGGMEKTKKD
jgi:hypothetical protein